MLAPVSRLWVEEQELARTGSGGKVGGGGGRAVTACEVKSNEPFGCLQKRRNH